MFLTSFDKLCNMLVLSMCVFTNTSPHCDSMLGQANSGLFQTVLGCIDLTSEAVFFRLALGPKSLHLY